MAPGAWNLTIYRGDDFSLPLFLRDTEDPPNYIDLTGWTGRAQVRATVDSATVELTITVTILNQATALGGILLEADKLLTAALTIATGVWDLELTDDTGETATYLAGTVTVTKDVTRD